MPELHFQAVEFDDYELDPSENPRWNTLTRLWSQLQERLLVCVFPVYQEAIDRESFSELTYASRWLGTDLVSPFLKRPVLTIEDYIDHCSRQAQKWHREDERKVTTADRSKEFFDSRTRLRKQKDDEAGVTAARIAWREAIRRKKKTIAQMDEEIRTLRERFVRLRDGLETPVAKS